MDRTVVILLAVSASLAAAAGCSAPDIDSRLAAVESELKALRMEMAAWTARRGEAVSPPSAPGSLAVSAGLPAADPTSDLAAASMSDWRPPPGLESKLRAIALVQAVAGNDELKREIQSIRDKVGPLDDVKKAVEAIQEAMKKQR
jgi:hypothetical protein